MATPFAAALAVVDTAIAAIAGEECVCRSGELTATITVVFGSHLEQTFDARGLPLTVRKTDALIRYADLDFGSGPIEPPANLEIDRVVNGATETLRIAATSDDRGYRRSDGDGNTWRIHVERVA